MAVENVPTTGSEQCRQLPYPTTESCILISLASATKRCRTNYLMMVIALEEVEHRDKVAVAASLVDKMWCSVHCEPVFPNYCTGLCCSLVEEGRDSCVVSFLDKVEFR